MMPDTVRVLVLTAALWTLGPISSSAQTVGVSPRVMNFTRTAHTLFDLKEPPFGGGPLATAQFVEFGPSPFGVEMVPFRLREIRLDNLPSGAATNFVIVSPSAGVTVARIHRTAVVALNPKVVPYMRPGIYNLILLFENPERPELGTGGVDVRLILNSPGRPEITSVVNAASLRPGLSPGQLVTIRGTHLSSPPVTGEADSTGLFPKVIGHTRVTFNGIAAPLLYVSNEQINCVVPHGVAGSRTAQVAIEDLAPFGDVYPSPAFTVSVADTSPGIFTADQSGNGPGAILNTGAGTGFNSESNPAPRGSAVTFYATGTGAWNVAYPDGSLVLSRHLALPPPNPEFLAPLATVSVTIGGQPARVLEATAQPMRVSGMLQVTAEIPPGIGAGEQPVVLTIGNNSNSQQWLTVAVQ